MTGFTHEIRNCIVLLGPELEPHLVERFAWRGDTVTAIEVVRPYGPSDGGGLVIMPGLYNGHTHIGDAALPDGATGMTLEEAFFRPNGFKYRELEKLSPEEHLPHLIAQQRFMARTGTICHLDFREQGAEGAELLRQASEVTGVQSVILSQFRHAPFTDAELKENRAPLPERKRTSIEAMLAVADGFSESTMNDLTDAAWLEIRHICESRKKLRAVHCLENPAYRERSVAMSGRGDLIRAIEIYDANLIVHLTVATDEEIARLVQHAATAAVNPRANATLGLALPPVAALLQAGVNLLLGTDNVMLNPPSLLAELDFTYRLARSQSGNATEPDPRAMLRLVTTNIRPLLGGQHYGYLDRGLPASFVVADLRQPHLRATRHLLASLVTRLTPADILATYHAGRDLWRSSQFSL